MSVTLEKLGINLAYFPRDQQDEAVEQISMLRMEQILMGEGQTFNWNILIQKPELIELNDHKQKNSLFQQEVTLNDEDLDVWPYAEQSLCLFSKESHFRLSILKLIKMKYYIHSNVRDLEWINRIMIVINMIAFVIYSYDTRVWGGYPEQNRISVGLEVICNIYFVIEALLNIIAQGLIFEKGTYLRNLWNMVNFTTLFTCWSCLASADDNHIFIMLVRFLRLLRGIRLIQEFPALRTQMDAFVGSLTKLGSIMIPLIFVMLFYCIVGLHLFSGVTENRCRYTPEPVNNKWDADPEIQFLCGVWECPENRYCGNPGDYGLPSKQATENDYEALNYNFSKFDNFFDALYVVYTYLNIIGWSGTNYLFWKAINSKVTAFFFVTLIFILAFVLSNLLLATFYESFLDQSSIKQNNKAKQEEAQLETEIQKKRQQQMMDRLAVLGDQKRQSTNKNQIKMSLYFSEEEKHHTLIGEQMQNLHKLSLKISKSIYFTNFNLIAIIICSLALCLDRDRIPDYQWKQLQEIDFACTIYFYFELLINLWGKGIKGHLKKFVNKLDVSVVLSQVALFVYIFVVQQPLIYNYNLGVQIWKTVKIVRIIKLLYSAKLFHDISVLTRCLFETLQKMIYMIILWSALILIIALCGQEIFGFRVRYILEEHEFEAHAHDFKDPEALAPMLNYEGIGNSIMSAVSIFYNEEWHLLMFQHARTFPFASITFYIVLAFICQVLFMRLFLAVFLNEFCKQLAHIDQAVKPISQHKQLKSIIAAIKFIFDRQKPKVHGEKETVNRDEQSSPINNAKQPVKVKPTHFTQNQRDGSKDEAGNDDEEYMIQNAGDGRRNENQDLQSQNSQHKDTHSSRREMLENQYVEKTFFVFTVNNPFRRFVINLVQNKFFISFYLLLIIAASIRGGIENPLSTDEEWEKLRVVFIVLTVFFAIINLLNIVAYGFITAPKSYVLQSPYNALSCAVTVYEIIACIIYIRHPLGVLASSLRIVQFIQIGAMLNKDINYAQISFFNAFGQMIQLSCFCVFIFIVYGVFGTKLLKGKLYSCNGLSEEIIHHHVHTRLDCFDYGGSWVSEILSFDTISDSLCMLFVTATSEGWVEILEKVWNATGTDLQPEENYNRYWALYYYIFFFIGFICMLNMFIGLIVNSYAEGKLKAQHLHLLDSTQREWFFIKEQILEMKPLCKSIKPQNPFRQILFYLIKNKRFKLFWLIIVGCNTIVLCLHYNRQDKDFETILDNLNAIFIYIFFIEILSRVIAKEFRLFTKDTINVIDLFGIWIAIANIYTRNDVSLDFQFRRAFNAVSVAFQLTRNFKIIKRFNEIEKLFSSIFSVLPSAMSMMYIMFIFLYVYTEVGVEMFAFLRPTPFLNGWDHHFRTFSCAMFTLIKVASIEQWFRQLIATATTVQPDFACVNISDYHDFLENGFNGCGTKIAYLYFITFHLIFSLLVVNLFIASVLLAYEEHVKSEQSAISKYQLQDVLALWVKYDNRGQGFINYKHFWKLSSEIAIIFGVDQSDLLDQNNKKNFLKVLNIPIYEFIETNMLCYRFHDVILSLTKISVTLKFGVTNLEPTDKDIIQKLEETHGLHHTLQSTFRPTEYTSGDMVTIIYIQGKVRTWKKKALNKGADGGQVGQISDLNKLLFKSQRVDP